MGVGAGPSTHQDENAINQASTWETDALNNYTTQSGAAASNVNASLAAGNPYQTKEYKTNQNLETSAAMHSTSDAADEANKQAVARTGQNAAAVPAQSAQNQRNAQQTMDKYNAGRDTANEQAWQGEKGQLLGDQIQLSGQAAGATAAAAGARNTADSNLTSAQQYNNLDDWKWINYGTKAVAGGLSGAAGG